MEKIVESALKGLRAGEAQTHRRLSVYPLFAGGDQPPEYFTLGEALTRNLVEIREVTSGGSVPNLLVLNNADLPVLLIDGEELVGAKQNRVVNASLLLRERTQTVIPVSCTEHGRWSYQSDKFDDADAVMARKLRASKQRSVGESLKSKQGFASDQGRVWEEIAELRQDAGVSSPTGAMQDIHESNRGSYAESLAAIPVRDGQLGLMASLDGRIAGMDIVSRPSAYARLHARILKSYAMEAIVGAGKPPAVPDAALIGGFAAFIDAILHCRETSQPSVGLGTDLRYENGAVCGSALVHAGAAIHAAFFAIDDLSQASTRHGRMRI